MSHRVERFDAGEVGSMAPRGVAPGKRARTEALGPGPRGAAGPNVAPAGARGPSPVPAERGAHDDPFGLHLFDGDGDGDGNEGTIRPREDDAPAANPLRGLVGGDGIIRPERKPRVVQLQEKLEERVGPPGPDEKPWTSGQLDIPTLLRLHAFQRSMGRTPKNWIADDEADTLWSGSGPTKPDKPNKPRKPQPDEPDDPHDPDPAEDVLPNPPEGLQRGDGMTEATRARRPHVRKLQRMLSESMDAELVCHGKFDGETCDLLNELQAKKGLPVEPRVSDKAAALLRARAARFPLINPELEDLLDAIWLQHQTTLHRALNGLDRLNADLAKPAEHGKNLLKSVVELAARSALATIPHFAAHLVAHLVHREKAKDVVEKPLELLAEDPDEVIKKIFELWQDEGKAPAQAAPDYIAAQRQAVITRESAIQEDFLLERKKKFRNVVITDDEAKKKPRPPGPREDPRLAPARESLETTRAIANAAEQKQYVGSLAGWSESLAMADLEEHKPTDPQGGVKMGNANAVDKARGVLDLHLSAQEAHPELPVRAPFKAVVRGLPLAAAKQLEGRAVSEVMATRDKLEATKDGKSVTSMPVRANVKLGIGDDFVLYVGRSRATTWNGVDRTDFIFRGRKYLAYKAHGIGTDPTQQNASDGARVVLDQELAGMPVPAVAIEND